MTEDPDWMSSADPHSPAEAEAADWVVRLSTADVDEADWLEFQAWLDAAPEHRPAFDAAQALWLELDAQTAAVAADLSPRMRVPERMATPEEEAWWDKADPGLVRIRVAAPDRPAARRPARPRWLLPLAAGLATAVVGAAAWREAMPTAIEHVTGAGERRTVALADGTKINLNSNSKIVVRYNHFSRKVALTGDEAAFDVAHDGVRPFTVSVDNATVRVVGTEFNVRRDEGDFAVTVRRGIVQVAPRAAPDAGAVRLVAGQQLISHAGQYRVANTAAVDDAFSWRRGQLVYRMRPLPEVVKDLNRYYSGHIVLSRQAAELNFSGVLTLDGEAAVVARLCELLPLASHAENGSIVLEARQAAR
jgi:transmembrane sensor